jgi:diaminopimelate epimerase
MIEHHGESPIAAHVPGGILSVSWQRGERAQLTGSASVEFERTIEL